MTYHFSENIQRGILFLLKSNKDFFLQIINLVKPEYFEFPVQGKIFEVIKAYYEEYKELPNDEFILEECRKHTNQRITFSSYEDELITVNSLDDDITGNPEYFLDLIERFSKREAMKAAISESISLVKEDRMEEVEALIKKALMVNRDVDVGQEYFNDFLERWQREFNSEVGIKHKTLFKSLDNKLEGGLNNKELAMVVAPPGIGKSIYLVNQGVRELMQGYNVLHFSCEMSEDRVAARYDSCITRVPLNKIKELSSQQEVKKRLSIFQDKFNSKLVIKEFPSGQANVNNIRSLLVQLENYQDFKPDVIIVDYLELLRPVRELQQEHLAQERIAQELRGLAMEYNILVWTATQTNRLGASVSIITDKELGDSYGKFRTCDLAVSLNQSVEERDEGTMRAWVMKNRNGQGRFLIPVNITYDTLLMKETEGEEVNAA